MSDSTENCVNYLKFISNERLTNEYSIDDCPLGHGTYGVVIKARNKIDDKDYAIKLIVIKAYKKSELTYQSPNGVEYIESERTIQQDFEKKIRELKIWAKLTDLDHCVQYRSAWLENHSESKQRYLKLYFECFPAANEKAQKDFRQSLEQTDFVVLHIQMDLCEMSLKDGLMQIEDYFQLKNTQPLPQLAFYISSQILIDVLKAVDFLHSRPDPVMHRDIKPENFLFKFVGNGRSIKLADFGLAVLHVTHTQKHTKYMGTDRYMAPEVRMTQNYSELADIYSLGVMMSEMFHIDINRLCLNEINQSIKQQYDSIIEMTTRALAGRSGARPKCSEMLSKMNEWVLDFSAVKTQIEELSKNWTEINRNTSFVDRYLKMKLDTTNDK